MKLLKQINTKQIEEDAAGGAVGGGAVASVAMPLFSRLAKRTTNPPLTLPARRKKKKPIERRLSEYVVSLAEDDSAPTSGQAPKTPNATYDSTEVFAKLKAFQNKETTDRRDTITFGLEDEHGNIVRVSVKKDQEESFDNALNQFLMQEDDVDQTLPDVAEVLFKLKDHFDILNVEWPEVEEDEEEDQQINVQGEVDDISGDGAGGEMDVEMSTDVESEAGAKGLLQQVIDMMMADAEARKAEAIARQKEAEASVATNAAREAESKVKQEEELLDMEQWEKQKKEEKKEAQKLARLARWKSETGQDEIADDVEDVEVPDVDITKKTTNIMMPPGGEEEERGATIRGRVKPADVASFIMSRIK